MEKKSNKGMYAIIGVIIALVAAAIIITLVLVFNKEKDKKNASGNTSSAVTDEISQISNNANESDQELSSKENSESDDSEQKTTGESGKMTMDYNGKSTWASFKVPDGFYMESVDNSEGYATETFLNNDVSTVVDCYIFASEEYYNNAENYAAISADWISENGSENSDLEVKTTEINGNKYYYVEAKYNYSGSEYQRVYAACDINDSAIYAVEAIVIDEDIDLSIDTIKGFMDSEFEDYNVES